MVATLAACGMYDIGVLDRSGLTLSLLTIDLASGVALALRAGLPRLLAFGYAVTVPIYFANLMFGIDLSATFTVVYVIAGVQVAGLAIGTVGPGTGIRLRWSAVSPFVSIPRRNAAHMAESGGVLEKS